MAFVLRLREVERVVIGGCNCEVRFPRLYQNAGRRELSECNYSVSRFAGVRGVRSESLSIRFRGASYAVVGVDTASFSDGSRRWMVGLPVCR